MRVLLSCIALAFFLSCSQASNKLPDQEKSAMLDTIKTRMKAGVEDYVASSKAPAKKLFLTSAFLLDKAREKMNKEQGFVKKEDGDIEDQIKIKVIKYSLKNEKQHELKINERDAIETSSSPFFEEHNRTYSNFGILIPLTEEYKILKGSITIEMKIDDANKREFTIPIDLKVEDYYGK